MLENEDGIEQYRIVKIKSFIIRDIIGTESSAVLSYFQIERKNLV